MNAEIGWEITNDGSCRLRVMDLTDYEGEDRSDFCVSFDVVQHGTQADSVLLGPMNVGVDYDPKVVTEMLLDTEVDGHYELVITVERFEDGAEGEEPTRVWFDKAKKDVVVLCRTNECYCKAVQQISTDVACEECGESCNDGTEDDDDVLVKAKHARCAVIIQTQNGNYAAVAKLIEMLEVYCDQLNDTGVNSNCGC